MQDEKFCFSNACFNMASLTREHVKQHFVLTCIVPFSNIAAVKILSLVIHQKVTPICLCDLKKPTASTLWKLTSLILFSDSTEISL